MFIAVTAVVFLFLGREVSLRWWPAASTGSYERAAYSAVLGLSLWLGSLWVLALLQIMIPSLLLARTAVALLALLFMRRRRSAAPGGGWREKALWLLAAPWIAFIAWRGWLLPPVNHDALAYHLPKAVLFARAAGFDTLSQLDARIAKIPANYEMLLAEAVVLQGNDTVTEWFSILFYVLFAIAAAAVAERWWGSRPTLVALFTAGIPVALLHSGAHKNDLMTAFLIVAGLVAGGRFISTGDRYSLLTTILAFAAAVGTKPQAGLVALCLAPAILWKASARQIAWGAGVGVVAFAVLGGAVYASNLIESRSAMGVHATGEDVLQYGDWSNLWQAPYVLLAAPFASDANQLPVPWAERPWFWRRYEIFFSHLGVPFALCAIVTPFALIALRRRAPREALVVTAVAAAAFLMMLPVTFQPHGLYAISLPRYALFIVPIVFGWTVAALPARAFAGVAGMAAISFAAYAIDVGRHDVFAPWPYVQWVREHPDTRVVPFDPYRAAEVVDRRAGPEDRIAMDAAFGSWIHPAFGANLSRPVDFIPAGGGAPAIPDDARWVVIDRAWNMIWQHPDFHDLSQARDFLVRGTVGATDERVMNHLRGDSRFKLIFYDPKTYQVVFQRVR